MTNLGEITAQLGIHSNIKGDMARAQMQLRSGVNRMDTSTRQSMAKMAGALSMAGVAAGGALAVGVGIATKKFVGFEKTVASAASVTGATGEAFEKAKQNIAAVSKELGSSTTFKATEAANAMYDLASSGYDVANMTKDQLQPILDVAAGTQSDLAGTTEIMTSTLGQFNLTMDDSERVADVFARTIGSSKATIDKLGTSMSYVGPVAASMGMDIEETSGALGVLYNSGLDGSMAGTALRGALSKLANPTGAAASRLEDLGISLDQVNPETNDFKDILQLLSDAGMSSADAMEIFGQRAGPAMLTLTDKASDVKDMTSTLNDAGGAAGTMAEQNLDTLSGSLDLLGSAFEGVMLEVGGAAAPAIRGFADLLTASIPTLQKFVDSGIGFFKELGTALAPTFENIKDIVGSLAGIFGDLFGGMEDGSPIIDIIAGGMEALTGALAAVLGFFDEHPTITKFIVIIAGLAVGLAALPLIIEGIVVGLFGLVGAVSGFIGAVTSGASLLATIVGILGGPITIIIALVAALALAWATNWGGIREKTWAAVDFIVGIFTGFVNFLKDTITSAGDKLLLFLGPIGAIIYAFKNWDKISEHITDALTSAKDILTGYIDTFKEAGRAMIGGLASGITDRFRGLYDTVRSGADKIRRLLPSSPAKEGPFKKIPQWDTVITDPLRTTVAKVSGITPDIARSLADIRKPIDDAARQPGTGGTAVGSFTGHVPAIGPNQGPGAAERAMFKDILNALQNPGNQGDINIKDVKLDSAYNFEQLMRDIDQYNKHRRIRRGVRT